MSRKTNNLRKRLRIQRERENTISRQFAEREARAIAAEATARHAQDQLSKKAAVTIAVDAPDYLPRKTMELRLQFDPRRIHLAAAYGKRARMAGGMADLGWEFRNIAREVEEKVYRALMDYAQKKQGMAV